MWPARGDGILRANGLDYVFGLTDTLALAANVVRVERAVEHKDAVRGFVATTHSAKSWKKARRAAAEIEATRMGLDIRYMVSSIATGTTERLYADFYCQHGQAENLIKLRKT